MNSTSTSVTLLSRVRVKDKDAWNRLVAIYTPFIRRVCTNLKLIGHENVEDVTQEVFAAVAKNIDRFQRDQPGQSFRAWLRIITRNCVSNWFRKNGKELKTVSGLGLEQIERKTEQTYDTEDKQELLVAKMLELMRTDFEDRTWQAAWLYYLEGKSTQQVCEELNLKSATARKYRQRVLQRLKEEFGDMLDF